MDKLAQIRDTFKERLIKVEKPNVQRTYIDIRPEDLLDVATYFFRDLDLRFIIVSGIDIPEGIEILYHFSDDSIGTVFSIRTVVPDKKNPKIPSLSGVITGASWIEREVHELLGVDFTGHPNLTHLLLPEDWPKGKYPLRRDYE